MVAVWPRSDCIDWALMAFSPRLDGGAMADVGVVVVVFIISQPAEPSDGGGPYQDKVPDAVARGALLSDIGTRQAGREGGKRGTGNGERERRGRGRGRGRRDVWRACNGGDVEEGRGGEERGGVVLCMRVGWQVTTTAMYTSYLHCANHRKPIPIQPKRIQKQLSS